MAAAAQVISKDKVIIGRIRITCIQDHPSTEIAASKRSISGAEQQSHAAMFGSSQPLPSALEGVIVAERKLSEEEFNRLNREASKHIKLHVLPPCLDQVLMQ